MRLASVSSASSSSSSDSESSESPIFNGLEAIRQAYSKTDSMCSELSLASVKLMDNGDTCPEPSRKAVTRSKPPKTNGGRVQKKRKTPVINSPRGKMVRDNLLIVFLVVNIISFSKTK